MIHSRRRTTHFSVCTKQLQSGDSRDLGFHRNLHDQTWLPNKTNMEADCHCQLVALVCAMFRRNKRGGKLNESAWLIHFAAWAGSELEIKVTDASRSSHSHQLCLLNIQLLFLSHYRKVVSEEKSGSSIKIMSVNPSHFRVIWADNRCRPASSQECACDSREGWTQNLPKYLLVWGQHYATCCIAVFQMVKFSVITLTCVFQLLWENAA